MRSASASTSSEPPRVGGATPLGCALQYRRDPVGFLRRTQARVGDVFTLDLAGLEITLVACPERLAAFHAAPEDRLSARRAQADIGFAIVLGEINIHPAADIHRRLFGPDRKRWANDLRGRLWGECQRALVEAGSSSACPDLLAWMRSLAARVVLSTFVSPEVLDRLPTWVDDYARFQDRLEAAIAGALALPRWLGEPLLLRPVGRARERLTAPLAATLRTCRSPAPYLEQLRQHLGPDDDAGRQAQVSVGLLFAAYKNPSIGAAQTLLMLFEHPDWLARVREEIADRSSEAPDLRELPVLERVMRETLRRCALAIGSLRRVVGQPFELGGHRVPVGRFVGASHILMSMREDAWPRPELFDPDRFSPDRKEHTQVPHAWIPFSQGVHGCPGHRVALEFMACLVVGVLERFPAIRLRGALAPLDFTRATLAQRASPCAVVLR